MGRRFFEVFDGAGFLFAVPAEMYPGGIDEMADELWRPGAVIRRVDGVDTKIDCSRTWIERCDEDEDDYDPMLDCDVVRSIVIEHTKEKSDA